MQSITRSTTATLANVAAALLLLSIIHYTRAAEVITVAAPKGAKPVCARIDDAGTIHLLCDSSGGPLYARSSDGGKSFDLTLPVVDRAARKPGLEYSVWDTAVSPDGRVHVALGTNAWKLKLPQEEWGFYYTQLAPGDEVFAPVRNINRKPSEGFSLAADAKGNVTACWLSDKLYANVSHDGGETFGPNVELDERFNPCNCCTTSATYGGDGRLALLYREETNNDRDMHLVLWDQARNTVSRTQISRTRWHLDACPMTYYAIVPSGDGYLAAWPTKGTIYFAHLDARGELLPPGEIETPGNTGIRTGVLALSGAGGESLIAWKKGSKLAWQRYDSRGRPLPLPGSADSAGNGAAGVVDKSGNYVLFR